MGLPNFHVSVWHGMWVPSGTPKAVVTRLNTAVSEALADPVLQRQFADLGQDVPALDLQTPTGLATLQKAEIDKWWPIITAAKIKGE
jgi:tripartite-type tricarboxylate transporter receptor subunit TctC